MPRRLSWALNASVALALLLAALVPARLPAAARLPVGSNAAVVARPAVTGMRPATHVAVEESRAPLGAPPVLRPVDPKQPLASLYVDPADICGGNIPCYTTIQAAVNAANAGDTVNVGPGTYRENVIVTKPLTLAGTNQRNTVVQPAISDPNCGGGGGGSLCPGASNIFLVQADDVTIHDFTLDGDNPTLNGGIPVGGANVDARNGIITNHLMGTYNNLQVFNTTVRNVFLRGMYASSGGSFNFHDNTVINVQGNQASIAIFNFGGAGAMTNNSVALANDAISANHSRGTQFLNNTVQNSLSGVHTDNAGDSGGSVADLIQGNRIPNCSTDGYGIFVYVPYIAPTVRGNTITGCAVGLAAFGQGAAVTTLFDQNAINGINLANSTGMYVTTDQLGFGYQNSTVLLTCNTITRNDVGLYMEQPGGAVANATLHQNNIYGNITYGVQNATTTTIDATNNWWGAASGPQHASNPGGTGDPVSDFVTFTPFLTSVAPCAAPLTTTVVVQPSDLEGWSSYDENTANHAFVNGSALPPYGTGSYQMTTGSGTGTNAGGKNYFATDAYSNTLLTSITTLLYSTYVDTTSTALASVDIVIDLQVDVDGNGTRDTAFVFEPTNSPDQHTITKGVWQTWNARQGKWRVTNAVCGQVPNTYLPLDTFLAGCPNAKMVHWYSRADGYATGLGAGQASGGSWANFIGYTDGFTIGFAANTTAYDFELSNPTAAEVRDLAAVPTGPTGVTVQWTSASEAAHLGYNVLRADSKAGAFHRVNAALIVGDAPLGGGTHRFSDPTGSTSSFYKIQAVDTANGTQDSAAFAVGATLPPVVAAPNKAAQAAEAAAFAAVNRVSPVRNKALALTTTPYKLTVTADGIARVTYEQLAAAGVPLAGVVADRLTLTSGPAGSRVVVPLALHVADPATFAPGDSFDFIAQAAPSPYGDSRAYFLSQGSSPGLHMGSIGVAGGVIGLGSPTGFSSTVHSEENTEYWQYDANMGAPQPEGPWYWTDTYFHPDTTATVQAPNYAGGAATMVVHLQAITSDDRVPADHHLQLRLNGTLVGDRLWQGLAVQDITLSLPAGLLQAGANTLALHTVADTGAAQDSVVLASVDTTYNRAYQAAGDSLRFTPSSSSNRRMIGVAVGGFSSPDVALYDVTNPAAPRAVPVTVNGSGSNYSLLAQVPRGDVKTLLAAAGPSLVPVTVSGPVAAGDLHSGNAAYVIVAYDSMISAAQTLAAQEQAEGLTTTIVPVSAIYDQFGAGVPDAAAIHAFFVATQSWATVPQYAVLLGSASYDSHGYTQSGAPDLVPTSYVVTYYMGRTASDAALGAGNLALGRLPARTPDEAAALVAKLGAYRTSSHTWGTQASLVADSGDDGPTFEGASETLAGTLGSTTVERLYASQLGSGTSAAILNSLNAGRALLNYYGHGSYQFWSGSNFFNLNSVNSLTNTGHETFITALTCQSGDFDWAPGTNLLTAALLKAQGGAIGALGATAASTPAGQEQLNEAVYQSLLSGARLGDALRAGAAATSDPDVRAQFVLLGDPALRLDLGH
ncbi:MAG: C25 family cysteine peptidase [Chloroflexota bacterium]|nr:C25 family cysteine peptidase [Chloroflexota bacterium]